MATLTAPRLQRVPVQTERVDIYQRVTNLIIEALENGTGKYRRPWATSDHFTASPINASNGKPYRGINVLTLWAEAQNAGYTSGAWATYKQWSEMGAQVRKGERGYKVVFWKFWESEPSPTLQPGEIQGNAKDTRVMAREYTVFNAAQVDGYQPPVVEIKPEADRIAIAESFFASVGVPVTHGSNRAYYRMETDAVTMPEFGAFESPEAYYAVLAHETTHWTGHASRLNRDLSGRFGTESYAMEELVAELGAAFTCASLGIINNVRDDHAPYIENWLKVLKSDKRAIFTAASHAQKATDWLMQQSGANLMGDEEESGG